jgi:cytochrome c-type biogenesis protein
MNIGFVVSFSAGVVSVLSPCVLPLIPIVVGQSLMKRELSQILLFITGFFMVFAVVTVLTVVFTAAVNHYLLYFRMVAASLITLIGVLLIFNKNIFKFYTPIHYEKGLGPFFMGFLTCLAWSPCYGPYVVAVAAYSASTGNMFLTAVNMAFFAGGFTLTLFLIAFTASKIKFKGMIKYYDDIRIFSGIIITIAGLYMLIGLI